MAIYIVDGKPRHGKTAFVIKEHIKDWLKEARDIHYKVYSNVFIKVENIKWLRKYYKKPEDCIGDIYSEKDRKDPKKLLYYWRNIDTWNYMDHGTIIADEGHQYFNARRWATLSPDTEFKLMQHGHDFLDIWCITPHWTRLDAALRTICEKVYRVERSIGWGNRTYLSRVSEHEIHDLERWERNPASFAQDIPEGEDVHCSTCTCYAKIDYTYFVPHWPFTAALYDTRQAVLPSKPMPLIHKTQYCPDPKCKYHKKGKVTHM